jgi:hypothetical protein
MDGLPGMKRGVETSNRENVKPIKKMVGPYPKTPLKKASNKLSGTSPIAVGAISFVLGLIVAFVVMEFMRGDLQGDLVNYTDEIRALFK